MREWRSARDLQHLRTEKLKLKKRKATVKNGCLFFARHLLFYHIFRPLSIEFKKIAQYLQFVYIYQNFLRNFAKTVYFSQNICYNIDAEGKRPFASKQERMPERALSKERVTV